MPGDFLSLDYFWGLDRDTRDAIRREFSYVNECVPGLHSVILELTYLWTIKSDLRSCIWINVSHFSIPTVAVKYVY